MRLPVGLVMSFPYPPGAHFPPAWPHVPMDLEITASVRLRLDNATLICCELLLLCVCRFNFFFRLTHIDGIYVFIWLPTSRCLIGTKPISELHFDLIHWGRVTHICVSKLPIIESDNGLAPGLLLIGPIGTNFSDIIIGIKIFSFKKMH